MMFRMRSTLFSLCLVLSAGMLSAQDSTAQQKKKKWLPALHFDTGVEMYYQYDFNQPASGNRPPYMVVYGRHNEFNINLVYAKGSAVHDRYRANIALMAGTYCEANLPLEPPVLRHIMEANIGVRLAKGLWLDAGILQPYIGFESAIGSDCWTLTRSLLADNSPYYFTGAKLTYTTPNDKFSAMVALTNGWQNITETPFNSNKAIGLQFNIKPSDKITLNYSSYIGYETPDSAQRWRWFSNTYGIFQLHEHFQFTLGFDIGLQEKTPGQLGNPDIWLSPVMVLRIPFARKFALATRVEYYQDRSRIIMPLNLPGKAEMMGYSLNLDYRPWEYILCRVEGRLLHNISDPVFVKGNGVSAFNPSVATTLIFRYGR